jgi:starch phosphorylase
LEKYASEKTFCKKFREIKQENKRRLVQNAYKATHIMINPESMCIVHAKRIHEYKRQLMTVLQIIGDYLALINDHVRPITPKTYIFAGKAAPSYTLAKLIIKLINNVAKVINNDSRVDDLLKVVFIPDYKVSVAEYLIPAADLSCQISTAGFEASGTGNMKFALNGALTIGTYDGANIEIREAVGAENFYLFGLKEEEIRERRINYNPREVYENSEYIKRILNSLNSTMFADNNYPQMFRPIYDALLNNDYYFVLADLEDFNKTMHQASQDYVDRNAWAKKSLKNVARIGYFSSDRSIKEYAENIWKVKTS